MKEKIYLFVLLSLLFGCENRLDKVNQKFDRAPETEITPIGGYIGSVQKIILKCVDYNDDCNRTYYSFSIESELDVTNGLVYQSGQQLSIDTDSNIFTIYYFSIDEKGLREPTKSKTYIVDSIPPVVQMTPGAGLYNSPQTISFSCIDELSGCAYINYKLAALSDATVPYVSLDVVGNVNTQNAIIIDKPVTVSYYVEDVVGNKTIGLEKKYRFEGYAKDVTSFSAVNYIDKILLKWDVAPDVVDIVGVEILRQSKPFTAKDRGVIVAQLGITKTTFLDTNITTDTNMHYKIRAVDSFGNTSLGLELTAKAIKLIVSPLKNSVTVEPITNVSVKFSTELLGASVDAQTFSVSGEVNPIAGSVSYNSSLNSIVFVPENRLSLATTYQVNLSEEILKIGGVPVNDQAIGWSFDIRNGAWNTSKKIDLGQASSVQSYSISRAIDGNYYIAYSQASLAVTNIFVVKVDLAGNLIGSITRLDSSVYSSISPRVMSNNLGAVTVTWRQYDANGVLHDMENTIVPGQVWSNTRATLIPDAPNSISNKAVLLDGQNNIHIVWVESNTLGNAILKSNYRNITRNWGTANTEIIGTSNRAVNPTVNIHLLNNNDVLAIWSTQVDNVMGSQGELRMNIRSIDTGWEQSKAQVIDNDIGWIRSRPNVASNSLGDLCITWSQLDATGTTNAWIKSIEAGKGWGAHAARIIDNSIERVSSPQVVLDDNKNIFAAWSQYSGSGQKWEIWATKIIWDGLNWDLRVPFLASGNSVGSTAGLNVKLDSIGNIRLIWSQEPDDYLSSLFGDILWSGSIQFDTPWTKESSIILDNQTHSYNPTVSVNADGSARVFWLLSPGGDANPVFDIWTSSFD